MKKFLFLSCLLLAFFINAQSQGSPMPYGPRILNTNEISLDNFERIPVMYNNGQIVDWIHKDSLGGNVDLSNYYTKPETEQVISDSIANLMTIDSENEVTEDWNIKNLFVDIGSDFSQQTSISFNEGLFRLDYNMSDAGSDENSFLIFNGSTLQSTDYDNNYFSLNSSGSSGSNESGMDAWSVNNIGIDGSNNGKYWQIRKSNDDTESSYLYFPVQTDDLNIKRLTLSVNGEFADEFGNIEIETGGTTSRFGLEDNTSSEARGFNSTSYFVENYSSGSYNLLIDKDSGYHKLETTNSSTNQNSTVYLQPEYAHLRHRDVSSNKRAMFEVKTFGFDDGEDITYKTFSEITSTDPIVLKTNSSIIYNHDVTDQTNLKSLVLDTDTGEVLLSDNSEGGNYIPLTGTEVGIPVSGDIEIQYNNSILFTNQSTIFTYLYTHDDIFEIAVEGENESIYSMYYTEGDDSGLRLIFTDDESKGIYSTEYHGAYYDANTYVQKKYVDDNFLPLPTEGTDGQVLTTDGAGTYTWETVSSGTTYTAGDGIDITSDEISVTQATDTEIGGVKIWKGTQAAYDALGSYDADTIYYIETPTYEDYLKSLPDYNASALQTLKNDNGTLKWVTD